MQYSVLLTIMLLLLNIGCTQQKSDITGINLLQEAEEYYLVGDYIESMKSINTYIRLTSEKDIKATPESDTKAYKFLGNIHLIYGDRLNALSYYKRDIASADKLNDKEEKLKLVYNLMLLHAELRQQSEVEKYINELKNIQGVDSNLRTYFYYCACANRDYAFSDKEHSVNWMEKALDLVDRHHLEPYLKYNPYRLICRILMEQNKYHEALKRVKEYESTIKTTREGPESELECAKALANIYMQIGDNANSIKYQQRIEHLSDSLDSQQQFFKARRELENSAQIENQKEDFRLQHYIISSFVFLISITGLVLYLFRHKRKETQGGSMNIRSEHENHPETADSVKKHPEIYKKICDAMTKEGFYKNPDLTIDVLATKIGTNVKYASQAISSHTGKNFRSYLNEMRIKEACRLLSDNETDMSIQDVSRQVGFVSQSVFIGAFRRETGLTPSNYIKNISEKN